MKPFWPSVIRPAIDALRPGTITEVGAYSGGTTVLLLQWAVENGADVHVIDPAPRFDVDGFARRFGQTFRFHKALSLDVIDRLPVPDLMLIDGDHNWYTVNRELHMLEATARSQGRPFPVTLLHDCAWPYARRDLYYDPSTIPEEARQPFARSGMLPGRSALDPRGLNPGLANATTEGGPRNGVLTGIEDFVAAAQEPIRLQLLPGFGGLGILAPDTTLERRPELASLLEKLMPSPHLAQLIQDMEQARNWLMLDRIAARREIRRLTQLRPGRQAPNPAGSAASRPNAGDVILEG